MPITCKYNKPAKPCSPAEWAAAFMCDHCEATGTTEICDHCYHKVFKNENVRLSCGQCHGTLSYTAERLDHAAAEEVIN